MRYHFLLPTEPSQEAAKYLASIRAVAREHGWDSVEPLHTFLFRRLKQAQIADRWEEDSRKGA